MKAILSAVLAFGVLAASSAAFAAAPMMRGHDHCTTITKKTMHHGHVVITRRRVCH